METTPATPTVPKQHAHKRSRSAVLKSIVTPSRNLSPAKKSPTKTHGDSSLLPHTAASELRPAFLPHDHPHAGHAALGEINQNRCSQSASPRKTDKMPLQSSKDGGRPPLFNLLNAARKQAERPSPKDQENTTPPGTASIEAPTPIWAQFTAQPAEDPFQPSKPTDRLASNITSKDFAANHGNIAKQKSPLEAPLRTQTNSKVGEAVAKYNAISDTRGSRPGLTGRELEAAFEAVLDTRNIPENMRHNMRMLDSGMKAELVRNAKSDTPKVDKVAEPTKSSLWDTLSRGRARSTAAERDRDQPASPSKRSRSRSRTFTLTKGERSPSKRARSNSRPRSLMLLKNLSSSSLHSLGNDGTVESKEQTSGPSSPDEPKDSLKRPDDFVKYLREQQTISEIEVGKLHKLRLLLRNETVSWVDTFILKDGMKELLRLLDRLRGIEWREEHDDLLLHEVLLCLKGLCTTERALNMLTKESAVLFPGLLNMLFDEERRGPSDFNTRGVIINILYMHLASAPGEKFEERAKSVLSHLSDPAPAEENKPVGFILQMQQRRPYLRWCKEISNVTKEVFWIFLHHHNVITVPATEQRPEGDSYKDRHFPRSRPPVPAASWVGGVEWEACNYLTSHLDVANGLIASMPTRAKRNELREDLRASGFEKIMGNTLRTCKEKFYGSIHDALRTWILAAAEDGWGVEDVKMGAPKDESSSPAKSPKKSPKKAPQLELPKLDLGGKNEAGGEGWL